MAFRKHQDSKTHREAIEAVITLPKTTADVGELLSKAHREEKVAARDMLTIILSSVRYLARQGLALRGDDDTESNLIQLLHLRAEDKPQLMKWLERSSRKYTSHENQNEMLEIMAHQIMRKLRGLIQKSPFLAIMVDETTDVSNKEQLTLVIRRIDENLDVFEEFLGMYSLLTTNAHSIVTAISDVLLRFEIPFAKIRGQCYDGCNTMAGSKSGVAAKIQENEPRAVFTHCYGHALSLSVSDTVKRSSVMRDCLDTCYELVKLIKFSPKRDAMLTRLKEEVESDAPSIRTLCPTRWTVRADSLASIMANYADLRRLWVEALAAASDTDMKARIQGITSQMDTFRFLFGLLLSELILRHTDKLSKTLQNPELSSVEGHEIALLTMATLQDVRSDRDFSLFWEKVELRRVQWDVEEPQLPRKRKVPTRYEQGSCEAQFHSTAKDLFRQVYFEAIDLAVSSIKNRFDQPGFKVYSNVEQLLFRACSGETYEEELTFVCKFYGEDLNRRDLETQLQIFRRLYQERTEKTDHPSIETLKKVLKSLSVAQRGLINMVCLAFQLLLVMPATNATSERSFSALRRIKTYLRSTMSQARLNHLMVLHYHQDFTDNLDMKLVANDFISARVTHECICKV